MDSKVPYMVSVTNLPKILDAIQKAGVPDAFNVDFLRDLGFTSSNDRPVIQVLKFLGMLDTSNRPQTAYREFVDHTKARGVLARQIRSAFDDLYLSDKEAHKKTVEQLKGWFKSKTGASDAVATKLASQFKALANYADFDKASVAALKTPEATAVSEEITPAAQIAGPVTPPIEPTRLGLVYRLEIHLPDTQNIETFRAIFRALREELNP